jgi:hypothetical protein
VVIYLTSSRDGYIAGFTSTEAAAGISDRTLYIKDHKFGVYVGGGGGPEHIELGDAVTGGTYHLILTCAAPNVVFYVKDQGSASFTTSATGGRVDYGESYRGLENGTDIRAIQTGNGRVTEEAWGRPAPFFAVGMAIYDPPDGFLPAAQAFDGAVMLANVSTTAYSAATVAARFAAPDGFLLWQQPDSVVISDIDETKGWDTGFWDVTPTPAVAPPIDAVTMALFLGGYLDLTPAAVMVEHVTQTQQGTPVLAFDVTVAVEVAEPAWLSWDDDAAHGWDIGVWDLTPAGFTSDVRAPPDLVAGWDLGAWGKLDSANQAVPVAA